MSKTADREKFAAEKLSPVLEPMVAALLREMPVDPRKFMIEYLEKTFPEKFQAQEPPSSFTPAPRSAPRVVDIPADKVLRVHSAVRWGKTLEQIEAVCAEQGVALDDALHAADPKNGNKALHISAQNGHMALTEVLAGSSQGGQAALDAALTHPELVGGVCQLRSLAMARSLEDARPGRRVPLLAVSGKEDDTLLSLVQWNLAKARKHTEQEAHVLEDLEHMAEYDACETAFFLDFLERLQLGRKDGFPACTDLACFEGVFPDLEDGG